MSKRTAVVAALLLALLVPAVPANAAAPVTVSGRVLDENGRGVATAKVSATVELTRPPTVADAIGGLFDGLFDALGCAFSFGLICDTSDSSPTTKLVDVTARTDRHGRYVFRFPEGWRVEAQVFEDVEATRPALVRGTLPPLTQTTLQYTGSGKLPPVRLWLRGATLDAVSTTQRRLRARVPAALGTPVDPPAVVLVQGAQTVWSYGAVPRTRTVDRRVVETGTTGTQTRVTTAIGSARATYRSGVRPVTKALRPASRGKPCASDSPLPRRLPDCPLTDGRLADEAYSNNDGRWVIDLGRLMVPDAYLARRCAVRAVATSVEGVVFVDVEVDEKERGVHTGRPVLPARYVRLDVGGCAPTELSVYATPYELPVTAPAPLPSAYSGVQKYGTGRLADEWTSPRLDQPVTTLRIGYAP